MLVFPYGRAVFHGGDKPFSIHANSVIRYRQSNPLVNR